MTWRDDGLETEVKIRISAAQVPELRRRFRESDCPIVHARAREENYLFDFSDGRLQKQGCALRLRLFGEGGILTFKGVARPDPLFKTRPELESEVTDPASLRLILESLGLAVSFKYEKYREIYRTATSRGTVFLCLDETPVGTFVELEGPEDGILESARRFGWESHQFIRKSYTELYREGPAES